MHSTKKNRAAVISRQGLGDGLMMMIASYHLKLSEYEVTFYHRLFHELKDFFSGYTFKDLPLEISEFSGFDLIIIEHYECDLIKELIRQRDKMKGKVHVIYPSFNEKYFSSPHLSDFLCKKNVSMNSNIQLATAKILGSSNVSKINGISIPPDLSHRKYIKRVVLHPTSNDDKKNWAKRKFIKTFNLLKEEGFSPIFSLAPHEVKYFDQENISFISFKTFHELACFIYESGYLIGNDSGPAHLSSNLNIPTIVIASNPNLMKLWKPDFHKTNVITAPSFIPNIKLLRLRNRCWPYFITTNMLFKQFKNMMKEDQKSLKFIS